MKNHDLMYTVITLMLMAALLWLPPISDARPDPPPPAAAACIVVVIGVACCGVMVYGLYKMCQSIPPDENPPPANVPPELLSNVPLPPNYFHQLPHLTMGWAMINNGIEDVQSEEGFAGNTRSTDWHTLYSFKRVPDDNGGMSLVAADANGVALATNSVPIMTANDGSLWAFFDFTGLPPAMTNTPAAQFFRLQSR